MTRRIVLLLACSAVVCIAHGNALGKEGGTGAPTPEVKPAAMIGPYTMYRFELRLWQGDQPMTESGTGVEDGGMGVVRCGQPGGLVSALVVILPPDGVLTRADLESHLDKDSARMFESAATKFCLGGVWFYVYAPGVDRCDVRITRHESWITGRGLCTLGDEHAVGWLSTRVFDPGVTLHSR